MVDQERLKKGAVCEYTAVAPGDTLFFIGGTHGNEQTGIEVVYEVARRFETGQYRLLNGMVRLALGNPKAVAMNVRLSDDTLDLNKSFTDAILEPPDMTGEVVERARMLAPYIRSSGVVIDIHSTQRPTAHPFISAKIDAAHEEVYQWFNPPITTVLEDPYFVFAGEPASIDEYADRVGAIGICLESGYAQSSSADMVLQGIENLLIARGMLKGELATPHTPTERYQWSESIAYDPDAGWEWAPGISVRSFEYIPAGTVFGFVQGVPVSREEDVYLLFPKTDEMRLLEKRVTYLARRLL